MAHLTTCSYCGGDVIDGSRHPECRAAFCEDLLAQIKRHAQLCLPFVVPGVVLSSEIISILRKEHFETKAERDKRIQQAEKLALEKTQWLQAKNDFLQQAALEWEESNKDPDPPQY